jgi:hypothetical protein
MASPINFSFNNTTSIDSYLNTSLYGGLSSAEGIDLRIEMHRILYGYVATRPKGHWITYRRYDPTTKSAYYNEQTKEGVGGPAYAYIDQFIRTRKVPISKRSDQLMQIKPGLDIGDEYVYYFEYSVVPKIGDDIFEVDLVDHTITNPKVCTYNLLERYKIKRVHPYRLESARIEYWLVVAQFDEVNY